MKQRPQQIIIDHFKNGYYVFTGKLTPMSFLLSTGKNLTSCKMVARVCTPFTEGHYYGKGEKPNTELADNSAFTHRSIADLIYPPTE